MKTETEFLQSIIGAFGNIEKQPQGFPTQELAIMHQDALVTVCDKVKERIEAIKEAPSSVGGCDLAKGSDFSIECVVKLKDDGSFEMIKSDLIQ